jgi:hypothetical protein
MSTIQEIEAAISQLSREDLARVREWLNQFSEAQSDSSSTESRLELERLTRLIPSQIQPPNLTTPEERAAAFQRWVDSHADVTAIADDSRESIY